MKRSKSTKTGRNFCVGLLDTILQAPVFAGGTAPPMTKAMSTDYQSVLLDFGNPTLPTSCDFVYGIEVLKVDYSITDLTSYGNEAYDGLRFSVGMFNGAVDQGLRTAWTTNYLQAQQNFESVAGKCIDSFGYGVFCESELPRAAPVYFGETNWTHDVTDDVGNGIIVLPKQGKLLIEVGFQVYPEVGAEAELFWNATVYYKFVKIPISEYLVLANAPV